MTKKTKDKGIRRAIAFERQLRLLPIVLPICVVLLVIATVLSVTSAIQLSNVRNNTDRIGETSERLRNAALRACAVDNQLIVRVNTNASIIYRVLKAAGSSNSSQAQAYDAIIADVEYTPPINCARAVNAKAYRAPAAIPFAELERQGLFDLRTGEIKTKGKR